MQPFPVLCLLAMWLAPQPAGAMPVLSTTSPAPATSRTACNAQDDALPGVAETFTVGTLHVQRYGDHGRPVILIPGLGSGPWVWANTIRHLRDDHVVYALTLAGFDGTPPPERRTGLMDQAVASLRELIEKHHVDHPVLVGHSLGGTLAIRFSEKHSDLLSGVVAVDGLPVFPGTESLTNGQRQAQARAMKMRMSSMSAEQFKAQQTRYMQYMGVKDEDLAERCGRLQSRSDPAATAEYMAEDLAGDDRPDLKNITVPVLEVSPYNAADFKQAAKRSGQPLITEKAKTKLYRDILSGAPRARVVSVENSRHFVMLDRPHEFARMLDEFLSRLSKED